VFDVYGVDYPTKDGSAVRDFTHIWDIANAHVKALEYLNAGGKTDSFNIGAGSGKSVLEMLTEYQDQKEQAITINVSPRRPGDIPMNYADIAKAKSILGWVPNMSSAKKIVEDAIRWYSSDLYKQLIHG
jgi:UDP-glucose 4-epimerase